MPSKSAGVSGVRVYPLTARRWRHLEQLFGERGACGGCWCMWWRVTRSRFDKQKGEGNRKAFKKIVASGEVPGLLAYAEGKPVAWCALSRRETYSTLQRSRILQRVDGEPVWSVVCFFVAKPFRRRGMTVKLLQAAIEYARKRGARILEGYPMEPRQTDMPAVFAFTGLAAAFRRAGFKEVVRRSETRPIMRYLIRRR